MSSEQSNILDYFNNLNNAQISTDIGLRIKLLLKLKESLKANEDLIFDAMFKDLHRNANGTSLAELVPIYGEIHYFVKNLKKLTAVRKRCTDLMFTPSQSRIVPRPRGKVYVISPFNYPVILAISPLIGSIAAGNATLLRMSSQTPNVNAAIAKVVSVLPKELVSTVECSHSDSDTLTKAGFDLIFYTGSPTVGKHIMKLASEVLTPVVLELGGKSPLYISEDCDLDSFVHKMLWGKSFNAGQTCVAPDYVLIHRSQLEDFKLKIQEAANDFWPKGCSASDDFCRIITPSATKRVNELLQDGKDNYSVYVHRDEETDIEGRFIPFSCIYFNDLEEAMKSKIMQEEIFGPVWPIIAVDNVDEAIDYINAHPKPLALYVFSPNKGTVERFIYETDSGAIVSNDSLVHVANHNLPFGGVGNSGMGQYHGEFSFDTFSQMKPVMFRSGEKIRAVRPVDYVVSKIDSVVRFPPTSEDSKKALSHFAK